MQDVNDDMDELLRRAANSYPLNTESADWSRISAALQASETLQSITYLDRIRKYLRLLIFLILIGIPVVCVDYILMNNHHSGGNGVSLNPEPGKTLADVAKENLKKADAPATKIEFNKDSNNGSTVEARKRFRNRLKPFALKVTDFTADKKVKSNKAFPLKNNASQNTQDVAILIKKTDENAIANNSPIAGSIVEKTGIATPSAPEKTISSKNITDTISNIEKALHKEATVVKTPNKNHFYAGVLVGPDISTIKLQTVNNTGFSAGLVIGYSLSKKLSIETGALWDKKFYYTDGKYFNPKNLSIPSYIHIDDLEGSCKMIELPVNLSYKIKSYKKGFLTLNVGASSYFMKRENYSYTYQRNGVEGVWALSYKNSSNNLFSVVNIAAGYNHNLPASLVLRVEPYIKLPVSGIGSGRLPITSAGLNIILTRKIKK